MDISVPSGDFRVLRVKNLPTLLQRTRSQRRWNSLSTRRVKKKKEQEEEEEEEGIFRREEEVEY